MCMTSEMVLGLPEDTHILERRVGELCDGRALFAGCQLNTSANETGAAVELICIHIYHKL